MNHVNIAVLRKHVEKIGKEWKAKFPFLYRNKLASLYLMILGIAKTTTDLKNIHSTLGAKDKLLRTDLINFEEFWKKYFISPQNNIFAAAAHSWLLRAQAELAENNHSNTSYYKDYLLARRYQPDSGCLVGKDNLGFTSRHFMIISNENSIGHGDGHFRTSLSQNPNLDRIIALSCFLSEEKDEVIIQLELNEYDLTEELTHRLSQLPAYVIDTAGSSSWGGTRMKLSYAVTAKNLIQFLSEYKDPHCSGCKPYFTALEGFTEQLKSEINDIGIGCGIIHPITDNATYELLR